MKSSYSCFLIWALLEVAYAVRLIAPHTTAGSLSAIIMSAIGFVFFIKGCYHVLNNE